MGQLTTPHGDRERGISPTHSPDHPAHYPSWGSGTVALGEPSPIGHRLTTPHGDRERGVELPGERAQVRLTTPHGDRERSLATSRHCSPESHYPSWGSGTAAPPRTANVRANSLPLMGIGNSGNTSREMMASMFSLPLMGIGNGGVVGRAPVTGRLTTPHGDREPRFATDSGSVFASSLPLMGIGNPSPCPIAVPKSISAHYPSWGSGTPFDKYHPNSLSAHYPSWGSGTPCLLNPHRPRRAHYPSWGSGTSALVASVQLADVLLTTPHGDRELPKPMSGDDLVGRLTTPHGDREHRFHKRLLRCLRRTHYPSWGSGTSPSPSASTALTPTHYPSWGSGTVRNRCSPGTEELLTTPHGDRER